MSEEKKKTLTLNDLTADQIIDRIELLVHRRLKQYETTFKEAELLLLDAMCNFSQSSDRTVLYAQTEGEILARFYFEKSWREKPVYRWWELAEKYQRKREGDKEMSDGKY